MRDDDEDALPFASRPKVIRPKPVQKPKQVPAGVTTSYSEVVDGDSEDDDYGDIDNTMMPATRLAGAPAQSFLRTSPAFAGGASRASSCCLPEATRHEGGPLGRGS